MGEGGGSLEPVTELRPEQLVGKVVVRYPEGHTEAGVKLVAVKQAQAWANIPNRLSARLHNIREADTRRVVGQAVLERVAEKFASPDKLERTFAAEHMVQ